MKLNDQGLQKKLKRMEIKKLTNKALTLIFTV